MRITSLTTDDALLAEIGARVERARLDRDWTQARLAEEAGIGERTLKRLEAGQGATLANFLRVLRVLGLLDGLEVLVPEAGPEPGPAGGARGPAAPAGVGVDAGHAPPARPGGVVVG